MTSGLPALRALVIYGLCVPLALMVGYLLAGPLDYSTIAFFGVVLLVLGAPLLFKWHRALLIVAINASAIAFFIPGRPQFWLLMGVGSLTLSILQLALSRRFAFLSVSAITWPLLALLAVVLLTANFTGGIGFHVFGGQSVGGRRYINIFGAIMVYFALVARRIPPQKAPFYSGLFFLGGATAAVSSLVHFVTPGFYFIFMLFPPEAMPGAAGPESSESIMRLGGLGFASVALLCFLLSRYGVRGLLLSGKPWRSLALFACVVLSLFGGFRVVLITILFYLAFQAYLEGLFKSRLMPVMALGVVLFVAVAIPFTSKLPMTFQRALSVLPGVQVAPEAEEAARVSSEWRVKIWREVLPEVPQYLLLGKGYAINAEDFSQANSSSAIQDEGGTIVAGDYHNGPLSTIIPFGIWGALAFLWLLWAGGRMLYFNYRFGDPALKTINTFLFADFLAQTIVYLFVFGGFHSDMIHFTSLLGLSVSLNGGMCRPVHAPVRQSVNIPIRARLKPASGFSR